MTTWQGFLDAFKRLISSMKFWTFILALLTTVGAKYGFKVDDQMFWTIVGLFGALLGVQGLTDHGKGQQQIIAGRIDSLGSPAMLASGSIGTVSPELGAVKINQVASTDKPVSHELVLTNGYTVDITNALQSAGLVLTPTQTSQTSMKMEV